MKYYRYSLSMTLLNFLCVILFIPLFLVISLLHLEDGINFSFFVYYFLWMFLHELLHGIGFIINRDVNRSNIVYGVCLEKGIMYCMCKQRISKRGILISLLFPFMFIGVFTFLIDIFLNNKLLMLLSLFNIVGCIGDLVMFFDFLRLPNFFYIDLDDCTGFVLMSDVDLSNYKLFGIKLVEELEKLNKPCNCKKVCFSKFSIFIFVVLLVFFLIM